MNQTSETRRNALRYGTFRGLIATLRAREQADVVDLRRPRERSAK